MEKFCILAADSLISNSYFTARAAERTLQRQLEFAVMHTPLLIPEEPAPTAVESRHIIYVGRPDIHKGVLPTLKQCASLWRNGEDFRLTIVGADGNHSFLRDPSIGNYIRKHYAMWIESGHLTLLGRVDHAEVLAEMRRAWAVLVPSLWDSFPQTCLEAMGVGQLVLASRSGGQGEMVAVDGENGFLFDWNTPGDFERKLRLVLNLDPGERLRIAGNAQKHIRSMCDPDRFLSQRLEHLEQVIARHQPRRVFPTVTVGANKRAAQPEAPDGQNDPTAEGVVCGLVSVVMTYHGRGDRFAEAIQKVLASSYSALELIVVDCTSTALEDLKVLAAIDNRRLENVRVLRAQGGQLATLRRVGTEASRGEYVCFLEEDDLIQDDFLRLAIDVMRQYSNVGFVYSWVHYYGQPSEILPTWNAEFPYVLGQRMFPVAVFRRQLLSSTEGQATELEHEIEDLDRWITLVEQGWVGVSLPFPLVSRRATTGSWDEFHGANLGQLVGDLVSQRHPEAYRDWGLDLFNLQNANGPARLWQHPTSGPSLPEDLHARLEAQQAHIAHLERQLVEQQTRLAEGEREKVLLEKQHMSRPVIITGMHRSGTSLVTSILQKAGIDIGQRLMAPDRGNPRGYFEDPDFPRFHDQAFLDRGQGALPPKEFVFEATPEEVDRARALIRQREDRALWGWKDPRTCIFLEFWHQMLPKARFVLLYRHPLDVLHSLMRRGDLRSLGLLKGLKSWCVYNSKIKDFLERNRESSVLCHCYAIIDRPEAFIELLKHKLGLNVGIDAPVVDSLYQREELKRQRLTEAVTRTLAKIHPESVELYDWLNASADLPFAQTADSSPVSAELGELAEFTASFPGLQDIAARRTCLLLLVSLITPEMTETLSGELSRDITALLHQLRVTRAEQSLASTQLDVLASEISEKNLRLETLLTELTRLRVDYSAEVCAGEGLRQELDRHKQALHALRQTRTVRIARALGAFGRHS